MAKKCKGGDGSILSMTSKLISVTHEGKRYTPEEWDAKKKEDERKRQQVLDEIRNPDPSKMGFYFQDVEGNYWGIEDTSRLKAAKWWQRVRAYFFKSYRSKLVDLQAVPLKELDQHKNNLIKF